jgi:hypothetical protein
MARLVLQGCQVNCAYILSEACVCVCVCACACVCMCGVCICVCVRLCVVVCLVFGVFYFGLDVVELCVNTL